MNAAFFLDRDGVINVEVSYLSSPDRAELLPGVPEAIRAMHRAGHLVVVVTNQSGVARGMYKEEDVQAVHARIQRLLLGFGADATPDAYYCCCHHPEHTGPCECRKPAPGMLFAAARDFGIDLRESVMIGDRISDLSAGRNAGCKNSCLVKTGYGINEVSKAENAGFPVAADLPDAVKLLLNTER